jgi:hypothetical protein
VRSRDGKYAKSTRRAVKWEDGNWVYKVNSAAAVVDQTIETGCF